MSRRDLAVYSLKNLGANKKRVRNVAFVLVLTACNRLSHTYEYQQQSRGKSWIEIMPLDSYGCAESLRVTFRPTKKLVYVDCDGLCVRASGGNCARTFRVPFDPLPELTRVVVVTRRWTPYQRRSGLLSLQEISRGCS